MKMRTYSLVLLVVVAFLSSFATAEVLHGEVTGVTDGDTITLLNSQKQQHKIRLGGIDAPEKAQPFGRRSMQSLSELVFGRTVSVEVNKRDRYGRLVGRVLVDGLDANLEQVRRGLAWHYKTYQEEQPLLDRLLYIRTEREAQEGRRGLWEDARPVPPWEWRRRKATSRGDLEAGATPVQMVCKLSSFLVALEVGVVPSPTPHMWRGQGLGTFGRIDSGAVTSACTRSSSPRTSKQDNST